MGLAMAGALTRKGFAVLGADLSSARIDAAAAAGIEAASSDDILFGCEVVVASLPDARSVAGVLSGKLKSGLRASPLTVIDTSTSEPAVSRALEAELSALGHRFLDAPVSGGPAGAAAGALTFMVGGSPEALEAARPVLDALGKKVVHAGGPGAGNVVKLVNNMLVACHMITTREALRLAEASGVDVGSVFAAVNGATGRSAISEIHYPTWVLSDRFDSGFSAGLMRKDLRLALEMADGFGVAAPLAAQAAALWAESVSGLADGEDFTRIARAPDGEVAR
jgi:3-hydroxyisobutyrate dehydrogenase